MSTGAREAKSRTPEKGVRLCLSSQDGSGCSSLFFVKSRVGRGGLQPHPAADSTDHPAEQQGDEHRQAREMGTEAFEGAEKRQAGRREEELGQQRRQGGGKPADDPRPGPRPVNPFQYRLSA